MEHSSRFQLTTFFKPDDPGDQAQTNEELTTPVGFELGDLILIPPTDPVPDPELIL